MGKKLLRRSSGSQGGLVLWILLFCIPAGAAAQASPSDPLGRTTSRSTVLGFFKAARNGDFDTAAEYLNTKRRSKADADLARQLSVIMDRRLAARLSELSDHPEGSLAIPAKPDQDLVGTISSESGNVDILLERVDRGRAGRLWLFSARTLNSVPDLYAEMDIDTPGTMLPGVLATRILGIPLIQWLAILVGFPLFCVVMVLLNRRLSRLASRLRSQLRGNPNLPDPTILPGALRILLLVGTIRWILAKTTMPLLARQIWSTEAST